MTLGLIITGAIVQVYSTTKQQSDMQTSLTGRQEAVRFAAMIIQGDAQMAGYRGCLRDLGTVVNTLNNAGDFLYNYGQHVTGFENAGNLPGAIADVQPGTDVLTLRVAEDTGLLLQTDMLTSSADPVVSPNLQASVLASQDIALLADCSGAVVFQVHTYHSGTGMLQHAATGTPGNATLDLGRRFLAGAQVFRLQTNTYFIRESTSGTGPALWRRQGTQDQELAAGIENMQVLYGEDTDGDQSPNAYRTATEVQDWTQVVSLQVALLAAGTQARSADADTRIFNLLGENVDPTKDGTVSSDGRLRQVLTFTVAMRNRLS